MKNNDDATFFVVVIAILLIPFIAVWRGFVLSKLWGWFIVPVGLEPIGIAHAIGLSLAVTVFAQAKSGDDDKDKGTTEKLVTIMLTAVLIPAIIWLVGAIVHSFM